MSKFFAYSFAVLLALGIGGYLARDPLFFTFVYTDSRADWELQEIRRRQDDVGPEPANASIMKRVFEIAQENKGTRAELAAYLYVADQSSDSEEIRSAHQKLTEAVATGRIEDWSRALNDVRPAGRGKQSDAWDALATGLIDRCELEPDHPKAARLLCDTAILIAPDTDAESAPEQLQRIADLIRDGYASSPDIANFCEVVAILGNPASWSSIFETHLRRILDVNEDRFVRCSAHYALASIVQSSGETRQAEAERLYSEFLSEFDGEKEYRSQRVEQFYRHGAERALETLRNLGLGMKAPETSGSDLSGNSLSLNDLQGRVVLVSFWASWCGPCLKAVPHEKELLDTFDASEFAILGINVDSDLAAAKLAAESHGITWPSMQMSTHPKNWKVNEYPTFYLLDKDLKIRERWVGIPSKKTLHAKIQMLIDHEE